MCENCKAVISKTTPEFLAAMAEHGPALLETLQKINDASNAAPMAEMIANLEANGDGLDADMMRRLSAANFSPYVAGFLAGHTLFGAKEVAESAALFVSGCAVGHAAEATQNDASCVMGLIDPTETH